MKKSNLETQLQNRIVKALSPYGKVLRLQVGKYRSLDGKRIVSIGQKGTADLLFIGNGGKATFIEVKLPHGIVSEEQKDFLHEVARLGANAGVAKSVEDALSLANILHL